MRVIYVNLVTVFGLYEVNGMSYSNHEGANEPSTICRCFQLTKKDTCKEWGSNSVVILCHRNHSGPEKSDCETSWKSLIGLRSSHRNVAWLPEQPKEIGGTSLTLSLEMDL